MEVQLINTLSIAPPMFYTSYINSPPTTTEIFLNYVPKR